MGLLFSPHFSGVFINGLENTQETVIEPGSGKDVGKLSLGRGEQAVPGPRQHPLPICCDPKRSEAGSDDRITERTSKPSGEQIGLGLRLILGSSIRKNHRSLTADYRPTRLSSRKQKNRNEKEAEN